ncbi:MAG: HEAT repeat domain-containing protein [Spirochaetaceae bacterium]|nr:HEAT repeat domain-containing protein [Spirochaetaceae bacterium]
MNSHLLSDAAIRQFIVDGYVQVQTELPESVHRAIFEKTDAIFSKIRSPEVEWAYNPLNNVLPVVPELQQVMDAPQVRGALTSLLGPGYVMLPHRHCHPNFAKPESSVADGRKLIMGIHKDGHAGGQKPRHRVPRWAILFYYPQACPDEQGPTVIVPRSHYQHNLARQGDADPNLTLAARGDGSYGLPEHYIHRTMLPLAGGLGAVSIMHFDVGHSVIENLARQHRYGQKFVFMRTEEPEAATWDNRVEHWEQPDVAAIPDHEILWTYIWNWMSGGADRFRRGAGVRLQRHTAGELIGLLSAPEPAQRLQAANELGFLRATAAETEGTVAALVRALRDEYEPVRLNAAYALGAVGTPALAPLLELLATDAAFYEFDPVTHVSIAAHALGAMGGAAVDALAERLTADGEHTRSWAAYALGEIGRPSAGALPQLLAAARDDKSANVRRHALSAAGIVAVPGDGVEEALLERLANEPDSELRQYVLQALFRIGPTGSGGIPPLATALGDGDGYVAAYAAEQLFRTGTPEAFAALVPYLRGQRWFPHEPVSEQRITERRERARTQRLAKRRRAPELTVTVGGG